ncbi:MBL fold metallo-hydrolase [Sphingomicrobium nitratireducens]|uniref:MBL fold metallo-hydrolase n=1 Tax=Sphingomicrobium nitratireducens TaxID=2964666 RepID=UPI00223F457C|nr:MBL fold metallo-hydrolase [Sphingomicrobium nitratireducens]
MRPFTMLAALAAATAMPCPALAQDDMSEVEIKVEKVSPQVAVLYGQGGNIAVHTGGDGNVMVDDQFAPLTDKILAAVATLGEGPVRFLVNTHHHYDHTGGNENMGARGALIMAHDNVRTRLEEKLAEAEAKGEGSAEGAKGLPVITFLHGVTLHWNDDEIVMVHVENAHTDGDAIVHFTRNKVVHMGDTFFNKVTWPFVDIDSGGSINGMIAAVEATLAMTDADTVVIPGHGPVTDRAGLAAYGEMLTAIRDGVQAGIDAGRDLEAIQAEKLTDGYDWEDGFMSGDQFVAAVHRSLTMAE